MKEIINRLEYSILNEYEQKNSSNYTTWEYRNCVINITQLEHNKTLCDVINQYLNKYQFDLIVTSPEICTIFDSFENYFIIYDDCLDDNKNFIPFYLVEKDNEFISVVIKSNKINQNDIILCNTERTKFTIIHVVGLPEIKLIDFFKNKNNGK